jgi:ubiquinone/menaquinone biosynthesis C-methylase UbiE
MGYQKFKAGYSEIKFHPDWKVIDVGGGANPVLRADVVTNFESEKNQRGARIKKLVGKKMHNNLNMEKMDIFKDKEFDYSTCIQTIEHCDDPAKACKELMRISKKGYIECPQILCEELIGMQNHKWLVRIDEKNPNKLIFIKKKDFHTLDNFFYNMFYMNNPNRQTFVDILFKYVDKFILRFHWEGSFEFEVIQ